MKVTVCIGSSCHLKGSRQVVEQLQYLLAHNNLNEKVELAGTFCMGNCQEGVCVTVDDKHFSVSPDTVNDFFEAYTWHEDDFDVRPSRLWVTTEESIHIDANNLIEDACSDLHEDAFEQCDADGLQKLLDKWCKEQTGTSTYYPCYKEYVIIHWERY